MLLFSIQADLYLRNAYTFGDFVCVWVKGKILVTLLTSFRESA